MDALQCGYDRLTAALVWVGSDTSAVPNLTSSEETPLSNRDRLPSPFASPRLRNKTQRFFWGHFVYYERCQLEIFEKKGGYVCTYGVSAFRRVMKTWPFCSVRVHSHVSWRLVLYRFRLSCCPFQSCAKKSIKRQGESVTESQRLGSKEGSGRPWLTSVGRKIMP
jgi:hypothetical protein